MEHILKYICILISIEYFDKNKKNNKKSLKLKLFTLIKICKCIKSGGRGGGELNYSQVGKINNEKK